MANSVKRALIEGISAKYNTEHPAVVSTTNALNIISSQIYAKEDRFLYELLQNACDAAPEIVGGVDVDFSLTETGILRFSHNGRPFNADDVTSLCMIGASTKANDERQIGYKGIGFKSVFTHADRVHVQSGGYGFAFDKAHWLDEKRPWQIMPIWITPTEPEETTVIELHLRDSQRVRTYLTVLATHPELVLFLSNLAALRISVGNETEQIECCGTEGIVTLNHNSVPHGSFLVRHYIRDIPAEMREELKDDPSIPDKIKKMSALPITFALPLTGDGKPNADIQPLYSYYPTDDNIGLPVSVNSCFFTNASRERVLEEKPWNQHLLKIVADCLGVWLSELAVNPEWRGKMLYVLPPTSSGLSPLALLFRKFLKVALAKHNCIPTCSVKANVTVPLTVYDKTGLLTLFEISAYEAAKGDTRQRIHGDVQLVDERLGKFDYGLLNLSMSDFTNIVSYLHQKISTPDAQVRIAKHLFKNARNSPKLKETAWLLDTEGTLRKPEELFWQPDRFARTENQEAKLCFICTQINDEARNSDKLKGWLEELGVASIDPVKLIQKVLTPVIETGGTISDERCDHWLYLALEAHKSGMLSAPEYRTLRSLRVQTRCNRRKPLHECWIGGFYSGDSEWENLAGGRKEFAFIDETYPRSSGEIGFWKEFFIKCGAQANINLRKTSTVARDDLSADYIKWIDDKQIVASVYMPYTHKHSVSPFYSLNIDYALFADATIGVRVAQLFFRILSQKNLPELLTAAYQVDRNSFDVPSSLFHALATKSIWPARNGKCYLAQDLLIELDPALEELAGSDVSVLDLGSTTFSKEILKKFGLNTQLSKKQCLSLLMNIPKAHPEIAHPQECINILYSALSVLRAVEQIIPGKKTSIPADLKLLTAAGSYDRPENLYCAANRENLILFPDHEQAYCGSLNPQESTSLLTALGVNEVRQVDISVKSNDPMQEAALVSEIILRAPLYAALSCGKRASQGAYIDVLEEFMCFLEDLQAVRVKSFELKDSAHNRSREFDVGCFFDRSDNTLYVTGQWTSPSAMHMLAKEISRFLGIAEMAHDIHLLLQLDQSEGSIWLANEGYEVDLVFPKHSQCAMEVKDDPDKLPADSEADSQEAIIPNPASVRPPLHKRCTADDYSTSRDGAAFREKLTALLDAQASSHKGHIYHFTHVENIPNILREGRIAARAVLNGFLDSAGPGLIAQTTNDVKQFARFYFRPLTPTQWHNEGLGRSVNGIRAFCPVPIFLRISIRSALEVGGNLCAVSNGNLASNYSHFGNSVEFLEFFDDQNVYALYGTVPISTYMAASQQEFLVRGALDLTRCHVELICNDEQDRRTLETVLKEAAIDINYKTAVNSDFFHADAPRLRVFPHTANEIHIGLAGCRSIVDGAFSIDHSGGDSGTALKYQGLGVAVEQDISITGTLSGTTRIHYTENGETRLVYAATPPDYH